MNFNKYCSECGKLRKPSLRQKFLKDYDYDMRTGEKIIDYECLNKKCEEGSANSCPAYIKTGEHEFEVVNMWLFFLILKDKPCKYCKYTEVYNMRVGSI